MRPNRLLAHISLLAIVGLGLTACVNSATPDRPIQPTAVATQTMEQPATQEAPTAAPTEVPTEVPTAEPTLSPAERDYEWTDEEAVTVRLDATEEEIQETLEQLPGKFPLIEYSDEEGVYGMFCLIESISYLKEGHYVQMGDFDVRATAQCSYLDENDEKQTVTIALVIENRVEGTKWTPKYETEDGTFAPSWIQRFFETYEDIKPGSVIFADFGLPSDANHNIQVGTTEGLIHHWEAAAQLHSPEEISAYTTTGNPEMLGDPLILPFYAKVSTSIVGLEN